MALGHPSRQDFISCYNCYKEKGKCNTNETFHNFPFSHLTNLIDLMCVVAGMRKYRRRRLTAEEQLILDLFRGYDTDARAVINTQSTVTVTVQFLLLRIQRLVGINF